MTTGALIWLLANVSVGGTPVFQHLTALLDPFGRLIGLDGVILLAFVLGFPANELVMPLIVMGYLSTGTLAEVSDLFSFRALLVQNGLDLTVSTMIGKDDTDLPMWAATALQAMADNGIAMETDAMTRAEAADLLYQISKMTASAPGLQMYQ